MFPKSSRYYQPARSCGISINKWVLFANTRVAQRAYLGYSLDVLNKDELPKKAADLSLLPDKQIAIRFRIRLTNYRNTPVHHVAVAQNTGAQKSVILRSSFDLAPRKSWNFEGARYIRLAQFSWLVDTPKIFDASVEYHDVFGDSHRKLVLCGSYHAWLRAYIYVVRRGKERIARGQIGRRQAANSS